MTTQERKSSFTPPLSAPTGAARGAPLRTLAHAKKSGGQTMLLIVLVLGSAIVGAASLSALLTTYGLKQITRAQESAQAIFAADTGVEWALYQRFGNCKNPRQANPRCPPPAEYDAPFLETGARFELVEVRSGAPREERWFSVGTNSTGSVSRAMEITFKLLD